MKDNTPRTRLKVNDNVVVVSGTERGKRGKILKVFREKGRVIVEGINKRNKFVRPTQENPKGGSVNIEFPIALSNVMVFCEKCKKPVRLGIEIKDDVKIRVCKKCGKSFDK
ncbi:MAG TPA: 50S ribosomal protein L24 [Spirochaetota bacterium]|nr:50S ribosomal protein L24 [Spirochaetota bacterium]HRZ25313.1 50S ribosomal protein L24 [Spirochaetota bacterium]HSA15402.1 50S ribosomal protein L24 [Spirochaetota bacterium]